MTNIEILLIGVGLAMDAFAVSVAKGLQMKTINLRQLFILSAAFGGFQALMPLLGWLLGSTFAERLARYDHWIAFVLLALIGGNMIRESFEEDDEEEGRAEGLTLRVGEVLLLAVATSIDALAVGVTFSFLAVDIIKTIAIIGAVTFAISAAGVVLGNKTTGMLRGKAEILGGVLLIFLGLRILITHLIGSV